MQEAMKKTCDAVEDNYWQAINKNEKNAKVNEAIRDLELSRDKINDAIDCLRGAIE